MSDSNQKEEKKDEIKQEQKNEKKQEKKPDKICVEFKYNREDWTDPSMHFFEPVITDEIKNVQKGEEVVIPLQKIVLKVDYPLDKAKFFNLETENKEGFTRKKLMRSIADIYQMMYQEDNIDRFDI